MKLLKLATLFDFSSSTGLTLADDQTPNLTHNPAGCSLDWDGENQRSYFIQWSTTLGSWTYFPTIRSGDGSLISHGFNCTVPKFFLRLRWSDIPDGGNVNGADFDGDGVPNMVELTSIPQSDPLDQTDTGGDFDGDGLKDHWERHFFGGLNVANANDILGNDGLTNKDKSDLGLNPTTNYTQASTPHKSTFTYDLVGRLTTVSGSLTTQTLTLDEEGNILTSN